MKFMTDIRINSVSQRGVQEAGTEDRITRGFGYHIEINPREI